MVYEMNRKGQAVYQSELCLYGYRDLRTAERCEQYCATHESCSDEIMRKAIFKPEPKVMPYPR